MPGNWASKQASKLSSVVVEFVRKDRRVLLGCPFLPFVPFSSRPLSFTSIVDDSRDDLIRGQYRHRFRRSFLSFFAYSHSLILSQFFLFLRFEFFLFFFFVVIIGLEGEKHERIRGHPMYDPRGEIVSVLSIRSMLGIWSELSELEKSICKMSAKLQWRARHSRRKEITSRLFNMYPFFMFSAQHRLQIISHHSRLLPCSSKFYAPNGAPVTFRNVRVRCSRKRFLGRRRTDSKTQNGREIRFVNILSTFSFVFYNSE